MKNHYITLAALLAHGFHFDKPEADPAPVGQADETLAEEATRLQSEAQELFTKAKGEKRAFSDDEQKSQNARLIRLTAIKDMLDQQAKFAKIAFDAAAADDSDTGGKVRLPSDPPGKDASDQFTAGGRKLDKEKFSKAVTQWSKTGVMESQFATITSATNSGLLLPKQVLPPVMPTSPNAFREAFDFYGMTPMQTDTTAEIVIPVINIGTGDQPTEDETAEAENDADFDESIDLKPSTFSSKSIWFSNLQLAANEFDLLTAVVPDMVYAKELDLESGIVTSLIADSGITSAITTAATSAISYDELVDLNNALPKRYDRLKVMVLGQDAYNAARKLKGSDGHPVLVIDPQNQDVLRFNGTPVFRSDFLNGFGASKTIGVVYSLIGFKLRDVTVQNLARYVNQPAKRNRTGLELFSYHAFGWASSAVAKLKTPAS